MEKINLIPISKADLLATILAACPDFTCVQSIQSIDGLELWTAQGTYHGDIATKQTLGHPVFDVEANLLYAWAKMIDEDAEPSNYPFSW